MTIGELSLASGLPSSTIRYWERIGVLPKPPRVSGQRRYPADAVHTVAVLGWRSRVGFILKKCAGCFMAFGQEFRRRAAGRNLRNTKGSNSLIKWNGSRQCSRSWTACSNAIALTLQSAVE